MIGGATPCPTNEETDVPVLSRRNRRTAGGHPQARRPPDAAPCRRGAGDPRRHRPRRDRPCPHHRHGRLAVQRLRDLAAAERGTVRPRLALGYVRAHPAGARRAAEGNAHHRRLPVRGKRGAAPHDGDRGRGGRARRRHQHARQHAVALGFAGARHGGRAGTDRLDQDLYGGPCGPLSLRAIASRPR